MTVIPRDSNSTAMPLPTAVPSAGLSRGATIGIIGLGVGLGVPMLLLLVFLACFVRRRRRKGVQKVDEASQIDSTVAGQEIKYRRVSELTGSDLPNSPKTPLAGYYSTDNRSVPPISEVPPDSPLVEPYSRPPESASDVDGSRDYFRARKPHRRGAQRDRASKPQEIALAGQDKREATTDPNSSYGSDATCVELGSPALRATSKDTGAKRVLGLDNRTFLDNLPSIEGKKEEFYQERI